jgi:hypothetical protein
MKPEDFKQQLLGYFAEAGYDTSQDSPLVTTIVEQIYKAYAAAYHAHFDQLSWIYSLSSPDYINALKTLIGSPTKRKGRLVVQISAEINAEAFGSMASYTLSNDNLSISIDNFPLAFDPVIITRTDRTVILNCYTTAYFTPDTLPTTQSTLVISGEAAAFLLNPRIDSVVCSADISDEMEDEILLERLINFGWPTAESLEYRLKELTNSEVAVIPYASPWNFWGLDS